MNRFIRLKLVGNKSGEIYVGDNLEVTIKITKTTPYGHEGEDVEGYIIIKAQNRSSKKINIWGGCGA